ncbi:Alanine racemase [Methylophaga frappieri]|uniref:Alanine racemase n=1 Tax=Methylophaga frappieri (strain ATCC BAA-2434 / DSM 25690 / JAM7) TaxID=754477 RepID=I1YGL2_METFJ|nr:alanine racemase [Methylophaga frappieri]AFJ02055.1 Alanine racemase [Methylophaga frappieri]
MNNFPFARIDLSALRHNLKKVRQLAPQSQVMSVIKADAYGHGVAQVAAALSDSDAFAVARLDEAIQLRKLGFEQRIVILEGVHSLQQMQLAAEFALCPVIHQQAHVNWLRHPSANRIPFVWLMLETGMHRLGLSASVIRELIAALIQVFPDKVGLMSHFANSDLRDDPRNASQLDVIKDLAEETELPICVANSAAVLNLPDSHHDWVRPGLMLYGISPFADQSGLDLGLQPAMQLQSVLIATQQLQKGDQVGYGGEWVAVHSCRMGVVSIGYGDGFSRHLTNRGQVVIRETLLPVIGRVSMDTICILLDDCPEATTGDQVTLWGTPLLPVEAQAKAAQTIPYELTTVLAGRVTRKVVNG